MSKKKIQRDPNSKHCVQCGVPINGYDRRLRGDRCYNCSKVNIFSRNVFGDIPILPIEVRTRPRIYYSM